MKLYPRIRPWLLGCMCLLMCGCSPCDPDPDPDPDPDETTYHFTVSAACKATDSSGTDITQLDLVAGQTVEYCNNWSARSQVTFSVVGFLPGGALDLTLEPGECVTYVVDASRGAAEKL